MAKKKSKKKYKPGSAGNIIYIFPVLPGISGLAAVAVCENVVYTIVWGTVMVLLVFWSVAGSLKNQHQNIKWRSFTIVVNGDVAAFFSLIPFWGVFGKPLWLFILLAALFSLSMVITHCYKYDIANGIWSGGKTRFGKMFYLISFIFVFLSGGGTYGFTRNLQVFLGYNTTLVILSVCLLPFSFIMLMAFHCQWLSIKDPNWRPND
ncbi:MAG TPA: hypothetical protein VFK33_08065 [Bacillales bacterium]|nr:hypothetical protein [Bacillales bacterium]